MHYVLYVKEFIDRLFASIASVGSIWFCSWAIRRKGEFDYPLDSAAKIIRWIAVAVLMGIPASSPSLPINLRRVLGFSGLAFLVWPNFAYHLTRLFRWCRILPKAEQPPQNRPSRQQLADQSSPFRSVESPLFGFTGDAKDKKTHTVKWK